jgi:hypothetical protein
MLIPQQALMEDQPQERLDAPGKLSHVIPSNENFLEEHQTWVVTETHSEAAQRSHSTPIFTTSLLCRDPTRMK